MRGSGSGGGNAFLAATLSLFFCGAGQIYNQQTQVGTLMLLMQVLAVAANWAAIQLWTRMVSLAGLFGVSEWHLMLGIVGADVAVVLMMLTSIHQAYRFADDEAGGSQASGNPILCGLASLLLPGWGQLANGQAGKAVFFLFSTLAGVSVVVLTRLTPFLRLLATVDVNQSIMPRVTTGVMVMVGASAVMWILSVYDAALVSGFRRQMN